MNYSRTTLIVILGTLFLTVSAGCSLFKNTPSIDKPEMVYLEGGEFIMGDIFKGTNTDALPFHTVRLSDFYIGKYEVTFQQYDQFAEATGRPLPEDDGYGRGQRAVVKVDWYDAEAYCNYFGWRLPTEQEWEYAARAGGKKTEFSGTSDADSLSRYAITPKENIIFSFLVGQKKPNSVGIFDMSGNVKEWIGGYYQFYQQPENLTDLDNNEVRVIRGGSFKMAGNAASTYWRIGVLSNAEFYELGFRCAVSQEELNKQRFLNGFFHFKPAKP